MISKEELLGSCWGTGLDGVRGVPIIPRILSTVRCGKSLERWKARRTILVRQRDLTERRVILGLETAKTHKAWARQNELIEASNRAIDLLEEAAEVQAAHPEERIRVRFQEVRKVAKRRPKAVGRKSWQRK